MEGHLTIGRTVLQRAQYALSQAITSREAIMILGLAAQELTATL